jgi:hypothetical protein
MGNYEPYGAVYTLRTAYAVGEETAITLHTNNSTRQEIPYFRIPLACLLSLFWA